MPRKFIPSAIREEVLWSGPCAYCGDPFPTQVDHIVPLSRGGTNERGNLAPACRSCNMEKLDFTPDEYREWREEQGLGWPPESRAERFMAAIEEMYERYPEMRDRMSPAEIVKSLFE